MDGLQPRMVAVEQRVVGGQLGARILGGRCEKLAAYFESAFHMS
jgi:hypothetical protein